VASVLGTLADVRWAPYLALMAVYSSFYVLVDSFVVQQAVSWFNVRVPYRAILPVRATTYILSLLNTLLGQGGVALYLHRRYDVPFWEITGTVIFIVLVEIFQLALYSFVGAAAGGQLARAPWPAYLVLGAFAPLHLWFFSRPRTSRLYETPVFAAFRKARPRQYLELLLYKTPNLVAAVTVYWLALPLFGMHVPFTMLLAFLPLIFFLASLPIAAAHLGPPQLAWSIFFAGVAPGERLVAFSLAAHLTFMVMNACIGLLFLRKAMRELEGAAVTPDARAPLPG